MPSYRRTPIVAPRSGQALAAVSQPRSTTPVARPRTRAPQLPRHCFGYFHRSAKCIKGAVLKVFDRKSKCGWLTTPGLEFRLVVSHFRWLRCACLVLPASRSLILSPTLDLECALVRSFAPAGYDQSNLRNLRVRCRA